MARPSLQRSQRVALTLVLLAQFLTPMVVFSIGPLAPYLRQSLTLTREQIGILTALFYAGTALACIPAGWGVDRWGVRRLFVVAQVVGGLPLLAVPVLTTYDGLCLVLGIAGVAYGTATVVSSKAIYAWAPQERRATAFGAKLFALSLAGVVTSTVVPALVLWLAWPLIFLGIGGLVLASALATLVVYCEPPHDSARPTAPADPGAWRVLVRDGPFLRLVTVGSLFGGAQFAFITYLPLFLYESWGLSPLLAAGILAQAQLVAAGGRVLVGWVSDCWLQGERRALLRWLGVLAAGAVLSLLLLPRGTASPLLILSVLLYGVTGLSWGTAYLTLASESSREAVGLGVGISTAALYAGSTLTSPIFGYVTDRTGSYTLAWGILLCCLLLGVSQLGRTRPMT
jgi:MFS transporter, ACS family, hexuronate transporter